jgi:SNF2 family DNA or RNA helicase
MARHKWALSGTPILNGLDELYSYFKFLNVPHTGSFKIFKHNYTDPKEPESIERLLVRLSQFMIRRDHSDKMMGVPILKLPRASQMTHWTEFNSVERSVYEVVRQRFAKRINFSSRRGELDKQYNNALVMLLRLRQLTAHILMLQFVVRDLLEQEDIEKIREIVQQQATDQRSRKGNTIRAIRRQLDHLEAEAKKRSSKKAANHPREYMPMVADYDIADDDQGDVEELLDDDQDPDIDGGTGRLSAGRTFGKKFDFRPFLNSLTVGENWEKVKLRAECNGCGLRPTNAWVTSCGHIHCGKCYEDAGMEAAENGRMHATCLGCGSVFAHANHVGAVEGDGMFNGRITRAREKQHSKETQRIEQQDIAEDWLSFSGSVLPSAKTIALKAQIMNWLSEDSEVKIIIYTQFLAM